MNSISRLKTSTRFKKALFWLVLSLTFLYVFCVPSFGEKTDFSRYSIYLSMILLFCFSALYCFLYSDFKIRKLALLTLIFVFYSFIGTLFYSHQYLNWLSLLLLAGSFFVFVLSFKVIENKMIILHVVSCAFFVYTLYYIFHYRNDILSFNSFASGSFRLGFDFDNPNGVASTAVIGVCSSLYILLFSQKKIRFVFLMPCITSILVGFTTGSRTFFLIVAFIILIFLYFKFSNHKIIYIISVIAFIVALIILLNLPFMSTVRDRLILAFNTFFGIGYKVDTSTLSRVIWTDYAICLGSKNIIFGYGANGFSIFSGVGTYSHSNFAEIICNFGIFGFILFYSLPIIFFAKSIASKTIDKKLVITFVLFYLVIGFSNVFYYKKLYYLVLALLFYLVFMDGTVVKTFKELGGIKSIVFVCESMGPGGAEKVIATLSNEFNFKSIKTTIIGISDIGSNGSFYDLQEGNYVPLFSKINKKPNPFYKIARLRQTIIAINPDVVISFLPHINVYTSISLLFTRYKHIVSERNNPYVDPKNKLLRFLKKLSFIHADGRVFQTEGARNYYGKIIKDNSIVIKNPVCVSKISDEIIATRDKIVLAVGRLEEQKNIYCLLKAFKNFNARFDNSYHLHLYGEGPLKIELVDFCKEIGIEEYVNFCGNDANWQIKEFRDSLYVLSSNYEGMPNSLAEAIALGIPVVSTDCPPGGPRELIVDKVSGFLAKVNDPDDLAKKMVEAVVSEKTIDKKVQKQIADSMLPSTIAIIWIDYLNNLKINL